MKLLKCPSCGRYTLKDACHCGGVSRPPKPPRYSPQDRYGRYRRMMKEEMRNE